MIQCFRILCAYGRNSLQRETYSHFANSRMLHTSPVYGRIFEVPSEEEYSQLKRLYSDPKHTLSSLLQPLVETGVTQEPYIIFTPRLNGRRWKARLHVGWPYNLAFTGLHAEQARAEENAYLLACDLYKTIGMIAVVEGEAIPVDENHVFGLLEGLFEQGLRGNIEPSKFHMVTSRTMLGGLPTWHAEMQVPWPHGFTVSTTGTTMTSAQYSVCLLTCSKMKLLKMLNNNNCLNTVRLPKMTREAAMILTEVDREEFKPVYEIYVDASRVGFGAYLLTRDDDKVRWISDSWPEHFKNTMPLGQFDSTFYEYYALVAACYTWKHKFVNKRVLCWSDNKHAVDLVNKGPNVLTKTLSRYGRLYQIMSQMCSSYNITLKCLHVHRLENRAADLLSRVQVDKFKEFIPEAKHRSKKTKKLLFWKPLVDPSDKPEPPKGKPPKTS